MRKILICLMCLFTFALTNVYADEIAKPEVTDHEKVTIYLFRGNGCGHCQNALNYFNGIESEYEEYFEVKTYEVWYNQNNKAFLDDYLASKDQEFEGVPYIVIGDKYTRVGFAESLGEEIINAALKEYQNSKYVDEVAKMAKDYDDLSVTSVKAALKEESGEEAEEEKKDNSNDVYIIIGIFAVVILGGSALVFFSREK